MPFPDGLHHFRTADVRGIFHTVSEEHSMKIPVSPALATTCLLLFLNSAAVFAYGGGSSGSSSCSEPKFYEESPAKNAVLPALEEISLVASDNTDTSTLELEVNGKRLQPEISPRRSGEWTIKLKLPEPIRQAGKVRITLVAKSKAGCSTFYPYYLEIKP